MEKISYILLLTFFIGNCQNNGVVINFNNDDYQQKADSVLKKRYKLTKEFVDTYPEIYEKDKLIPYSYEMEELKIYSIPIYTLKRGKTFKCGDNIIDFIDFTSNPESQYINLEANGNLVGFTEIEADNVIDEIENTTAFELMDKILVLDNPEIPILGNNINVYSYKERLEKKYFLFNIEGILGDFIVKNNKIYFVKMVDYNKDNDVVDFSERLKKIKPTYVEINEYIHQNYDPNRINEIINDNNNSSLDGKIKKCNKKYLKKIEPLNIKLIIKNKSYETLEQGHK